jgi:L-amino acid N-acyltransferase YncA
MNRALVVRGLEPADWPAVEAIYLEGIKTGNATFEATPPTWAAFDAGKIRDLRLVAADGSRIVGWAAASAVSARPVYAGVAEHSVYVAASARARGAGRMLLASLIEKSEDLGFWTLQSGIFPENTASLALHQRFGFRIVGTRERLAKMTYGPHLGDWRDVLMVERRSNRAGRG